MTFNSKVFKTALSRFKTHLLAAVVKLKVADSFKLNGNTVDELTARIKVALFGRAGLGVLDILDFKTTGGGNGLNNNILCSKDVMAIKQMMQARDCNTVVGEAYAYVFSEELTDDMVVIKPAVPKVTYGDITIKGTLTVSVYASGIHRTFHCAQYNGYYDNVKPYTFYQYGRLGGEVAQFEPWQLVATNDAEYRQVSLFPDDNLIYLLKSIGPEKNLNYLIEPAIGAVLKIPTVDEITDEYDIQFDSNCVVTLTKSGPNVLLFDSSNGTILKHHPKHTLAVTTDGAVITLTHMGSNTWHLSGDLDVSPI